MPPGVFPALGMPPGVFLALHLNGLGWLVLDSAARSPSAAFRQLGAATMGPQASSSLERRWAPCSGQTADPGVLGWWPLRRLHARALHCLSVPI